MKKEEVYVKAIAIVKGYMTYLDSLCGGYPFDIITEVMPLRRNIWYNDFTKGYFKYIVSKGVSFDYYDKAKVTSSYLKLNGETYALGLMSMVDESALNFILGIALWITENKEVIPNIINNRKNQLNDLMNYESAFSNIQKQ